MTATRQERKAQRDASVERMRKAKEETAAIVATGKCPACASGIRRNMALTGWYQCQQFGAEGFRKDSTKPACNWQGFTD